MSALAEEFSALSPCFISVTDGVTEFWKEQEREFHIEICVLGLACITNKTHTHALNQQDCTLVFGVH